MHYAIYRPLKLPRQNLQFLRGERVHLGKARSRRFVRALDKRISFPATEADEVKQATPDLFDGYVKSDRILIRPEAWRRLLPSIAYQ